MMRMQPFIREQIIRLKRRTGILRSHRGGTGQQHRAEHFRSRDDRKKDLAVKGKRMDHWIKKAESYEDRDIRIWSSFCEVPEEMPM